MAQLVLSEEEARALYTLVTQDGSIRLFRYGGQDSLREPLTRALVELFRAAGQERLSPRSFDCSER